MRSCSHPLEFVLDRFGSGNARPGVLAKLARLRELFGAPAHRFFGSSFLVDT